MLAGIVIKIYHRYEFIRKICEEYTVKDDVEAFFSVTVTDEDIQKEKEICEEVFSDGVYEATCIHRAIVNQMVKYGRILIHSAVIAVDGQAYVFMAKSGVGKSTHIRQWMGLFGKRAFVVNGDKPMYSFDANDKLIVHGSPFKGKEGWGKNISVPVKAICLLERGEKNEIKEASKKEILDKIFNQVLIPNDSENILKFMKILDKMVNEIPFYRLKCTISQDAARVAYEKMSC